MSGAGSAQAGSAHDWSVWWRAAVTLFVVVIIALQPLPAGLPQHAWLYLAICGGVIAGLVLEPLPNAAVGFIGVTVVALLAPWVLLSPAELAKPGTDIASTAVTWTLSGFSNPIVWLVGCAFMFALGYEKTGLGRRIALTLVSRLGGHPLWLGYAVTFLEALLATVMPSNTARGAGTVFPLVSSLPAAYDSRPNDPSRRRVGAYLTYTAFAANAIASTLFLTGCAANFLALAAARQLAGVEIGWSQWFLAAAPFAIPLLLLMPLVVYIVYPPRLGRTTGMAAWARGQLDEMGRISEREIALAAIVVGTVLLWVFGDRWIDVTLAAFAAVACMLTLGVLNWNDVVRNQAAWSAIVLLATLLTLAGGLDRVGFVSWFAGFVGQRAGGLDPTHTIAALVAIYFVSHYFFASQTACTAVLFPVVLGVGLAIPGVPPDRLALALALSTGLTGVLTPYASGTAMPYYASGFIKPAEFWLLGTTLGTLFLAALLYGGIPALLRP